MERMSTTNGFEWAISEAPRHVALTMSGPSLSPVVTDLMEKRLREAAELDGSPTYGGKPWQWWVSNPTPTHAAIADAAGWTLKRRLLKLAVPLDSAPAACADTASLALREFDESTDLAALLRINNAAFTWHPDQHDWTPHELRRALDQPWALPRDILIAIGENDEPIGFCWMKIHNPGTPTGEIFLIAINPDIGGAGFGTALVCASLQHMINLGCQRAELWCEESNDRALRLYSRVGFKIEATEAAYGIGDPSPAATP